MAVEKLRRRALGADYVSVLRVCVRAALGALTRGQLDLPAPTYCLLESIGRSRTAGALQSRLASQIATTQVILFHHIRVLNRHGLL